MATASRKADKFSQVGYLQVIQSSANTLTFAGMTILTNFQANQAMVIHSIEYNISSATLAEMTDDGDAVNFGFTGSDSLSSIDLSDPEVYDFNIFKRLDQGTAASSTLQRFPITKDYTDLPGGGLLVPADRVFVYANSTGLASAGTVSARFRFSVINLSAQDYLELAQSLRVLK